MMRLRLFLITLLLALTATLAGLFTASRLVGPLDDSAAVTATMPTADSRRYDSSHAAQRDALTRGGLLNPAALDPLALNPAFAPLDREPADLPPFPATAPGIGVRHERRYQVADGGLVDEMSFWRIDRNEEAFEVQARRVMEHYARAAEARGFIAAQPAPLAAGAGAGQPVARSRLYIDPERPDRVLNVRVQPLGEKLHLTLWLRYAKPGP